MRKESEYIIFLEDFMSGSSNLRLAMDSSTKIRLIWDPIELPLKILKIYFDYQDGDFIQVVRIYEADSTASNNDDFQYFFEFPVSYHKGNWSVKGLIPNKSYFAEIGVKFSENQFFPLLRSNSVFIPMTNQAAEQNQTPQLHQIQEYPPKWSEYVSTYSYYHGSSVEKEND